MDVYVRNIDPALWREFKAQAARRGVSLGALLQQLIRAWLDRQDRQQESPS